MRIDLTDEVDRVSDEGDEIASEDAPVLFAVGSPPILSFDPLDPHSMESAEASWSGEDPFPGQYTALVKGSSVVVLHAGEDSRRSQVFVEVPTPPGSGTASNTRRVPNAVCWRGQLVVVQSRRIWFIDFPRDEKSAWEYVVIGIGSGD